MSQVLVVKSVYVPTADGMRLLFTEQQLIEVTTVDELRQRAVAPEAIEPPASERAGEAARKQTRPPASATPPENVSPVGSVDLAGKGDGSAEPPATEQAGEAQAVDETGAVRLSVPLQARAVGSACARLCAADTPPEDQYSGTGADVECIGRFKLPGHPTWGEDDAAWFERWKTRTNHECPASRLRFLLKAGLGTRYYICAQCGQVYRVRRWGCTEPPGSGGEPADAN